MKDKTTGKSKGYGYVEVTQQTILDQVMEAVAEAGSEKADDE